MLDNFIDEGHARFDLMWDPVEALAAFVGWVEDAIEAIADAAQRFEHWEDTLVAVGSALAGASPWYATLEAFDGSWSFLATEWSLLADGTTQSGSETVTVGAGGAGSCPRLGFRFSYNSATNADYAGETGDTYLKITNLRVKTIAGSVDADDVAGHILSQLGGELDTSTVYVDSPGQNLRDEVYEDLRPAEVLTKLARLGQDSTTPFEAMVWDEKRLRFRRKGQHATTWAVDYTDLRLERSIEGLVNRAYARYRDPSGRTLRTADAADAFSDVWVYGLEREDYVEVQTTSETTAERFRDALLEDKKAAEPRAQVSIEVLRDEHGTRYPLFLARAHDTIVVRNLPVTLTPDIDELTTFRIGRTRYDLVRDELTIEPEEPLPLVEVLLARGTKGWRCGEAEGCGACAWPTKNAEAGPLYRPRRFSSCTKRSAGGGKP